MLAFIIKIVLAVALVFVARYLSGLIKARSEKQPRPSEGDGGEDDFSFSRRSRGNDFGLSVPILRIIRNVARVLAGILALWAIIGTSVIWVSSGRFATLKRVYFASSLPPGRIVALEGELGPQARIITAGFHVEPFITLLNEVDESNEVFTVPNGQCAIMSAKDGIYTPSGSAFADPWADNVKQAMANNAVFFLTKGEKGGNGQRGPQSTVLQPGSYTINPFLWEQPRLIDATRVEQGTVGVVKSSLHAAVDFGPFKRPSPQSMELKILTRDKIPQDSALALLVPVGAIGVWEEPLPNGLYYINTDAYKVTKVPTTAQVNEYKGGYTRRNVEIWLNDQGQIEEKKTEVVIQAVPNAADTAIFTKPEGWDVPQELRVLTQISPELAPFVVASLGLTQENAAQIIEDRVTTPVIRSVVRDVIGGTQIPFVQTKALLDKDGKTALDDKGETKTYLAREFRAVKVMDLIENRASVEEAIETRAEPETKKEGITLLEVRLSESAIPPELLIARKREQLAQQLSRALIEEQRTQEQRKLTENARALANQQAALVTADIEAQAAEKRRVARKTQGEGEKEYFIAVAEGQKAQMNVFGQEQTVKLQMFDQILKLIGDIAEKKPEILTKGLENASKFVPSVVVTNSGGSNGGSLEGAAAIFANLMGGNSQGKKAVPASDK